MAKDRRFRAVPKARRSASRFLARMVPGARPGPVAGFVPVCLPNAAGAPPEGPGWVHEVLFRGMRIEAQSEAGQVALYDEAGESVAGHLPRLAAAVRALPVNRIVLDGVAIVQDAGGRSDPEALVRDIAAGRQDRLVYYAFDLLHLDGFDITAAPLLDRKRVLKALLDEAGAGPIAFSEHLAVEGREVLAGARGMRLAGIVSKRADAPYRSGRTADWVEIRIADQASTRERNGPE